MAKNTYTDINGISHKLNINTANNSMTIDILYRQAAEKAAKYAKEYHTDVFFALKVVDPITRKFTKGMFFLIPIERSEVSNINRLYGADHLIGISYCADIIVNQVF